MNPPGTRAATTAKARPGFYSKAFEQGIASLVDEIQLASRWSRPSILVAVHPGSAGQAKARARLKQEVEALGRRVQALEAGRGNPIRAALVHPRREQSVFFLAGIGRIGEAERREVYRALNFHRELLVEQRIILVLWLAAAEAAELPRLAPDFWAFRHRVVEFAPDRRPAKRAPS
jgi:hypothetical protein